MATARLVSALLFSSLTVASTGRILALQTARASDTEALHALFAAEWEYDLSEDPVRASTLGDRRWNDRWPDVTPAAHQRRLDHYQQVLARLDAIDRARLSPEDQLNYDLFSREYRTRVEEYRARLYLLALNQRDGIQTRSDLADVLRFDTVADYDAWVRRLERFPAYADGTVALLREAIAARLLQPKVIVQRVLAQIERQLVERPEESPFYRPFRRFPEHIGQGDRTRLADEARRAIATSVFPAFRRLRDMLRADYLPAAPDRPGLWQAPDGERLYAFLVRKFTTTGLTPRQVHELGLKEVARIEAELERLKAQVGFQGSLDDFYRVLRTDPRFYYRTPEDLLTAYRAVAKRIDPLLVRLFGRLPRMPYGVEPIPDLTAPDTTTAYYQEPAADGSRAGTFFVNLYKPETRPRYEMMALTLHEAVPGHHLQIALAQELGALPAFRRHAEFTAFVEGWALYAESLGEELGVYDDPYSKVGQLGYEMWRAVRLVVDTGLHALRWDRQQAVDYFTRYTPKTDLDIANEVDRYIAWPGQALAYKVGELKIKELRRRASDRLGARFDVRAFHDAVLGEGALPLDVLEARIEAWIAARGPDGAASRAR